MMNARVAEIHKRRWITILASSFCIHRLETIDAPEEVAKCRQVLQKIHFDRYCRYLLVCAPICTFCRTMHQVVLKHFGTSFLFICLCYLAWYEHCLRLGGPGKCAFLTSCQHFSCLYARLSNNGQLFSACVKEFLSHQG